MRGLTIAILLGGCGAENSGIDASPDAATDWLGEFTWTIEVTASEAVVRIDGVERDELVLALDGEAAAREREIVIEAEVGGVVAATRTLRGDCDSHCAPVAWSSRVEVLCSYDSGELRLDFVNCDGAGGCAGDAFCLAECGGGLVCPAGTRCGIDRVDAAPEYGWPSCVAIGPVGEGDACAIDAQGIDDCSDQLHCVAGSCRRACRPGGGGDQCGGAACEPVPGMSPEVGVCPPAA